MHSHQSHTRPRILHIRDSGGMFGGERVILTLGRNMDRGLFDFSLLCMDRGDGRSGHLLSAARRCGIRAESIAVNGRLDMRALKRLRSFIQDHGVSLIHTHDFKSDFYGLLSTRGLSVKRVSSAHGSTRDSVAKRLYLAFNEYLVYRGFDRVIAVSEDLKERLSGKLLDPEKIIVIQNGLDLSLLDICSGGPEPPLPGVGQAGSVVFAVIGRLYPDKGHSYFLKAFAELAPEAPNITGLIIGDGPERRNIEARIESLGLKGRVHCCGVRKNMKQVYGSIDCLVIPSLTEGLPYVMLEAMASGVPVLATAVGDIPLLVRDGLTGCLVGPGDAASLAEKMRSFLAMSSSVKAMAEQGRKLVMKRYSAPMMVQKTQKLYLSLLA